MKKIIVTLAIVLFASGTILSLALTNFAHGTKNEAVKCNAAEHAKGDAYTKKWGMKEGLNCYLRSWKFSPIKVKKQKENC